MAANDRIAKLRLRFETTQSDINKARTDVRALITDLDALEQQQDAINAAYARSLNNQLANSRALDQNDSFVNTLRSDLGSLADAQEEVNRTTLNGAEANDRLAASAQRARQAQRGSVSAGTAGRLEQIDRFGRTGGQILSGLGQGEAANAVNLVGDVADSFTRLNPIMLAVTGASVGLTAVLARARDATEQVRQATEKRIQAELDLRRFLSAATREEQRARQEELQQQLQTEERILANLTAEWEDTQISLERGFSVFDILRQQTGLAFGEATAINKAYEDQTGLVNDLRLQVEGLNSALSDPVLDSIYQLAAAIEISRDKAEQASAVIKQDYIQAVELATEKELALSKATKERALAADAARQQGLTDVTDQLFKANNEVLDAYEKERLAKEALVASQNETASKIAELQNEAASEQVKNTEEAGKQRNKIIADSEERILDITRKGARSVLNAIGHRDAEAAYQAKVQAKDQIDDEKRAQEKRLAELRDNLQDQNRAVDQRLQERVRIETARGNEEIAARRRTYEQLEIDRTNALNAQRAIQQQFNILAGQEAFKGGQNLVTQFKAGMEIELSKTMLGRTGGSGGSKDFSYFYTAPRFTGTLAPATPTQFTNTGTGGNTINYSPTIKGQTYQQVNQQMTSMQTQFLKQLYGQSSPR